MATIYSVGKKELIGTLTAAEVAALSGDYIVASEVEITQISTIPSSVNLEVTNIGRIKLTADLTFNGTLSAGNYQIFTGSGNITNLKEVKTDWFGENTTPGTTNMTAAAQKAINAAKVVRFNADTYLIDTATLRSNVSLIGAGIDKTIIMQGTIAGSGQGTFYALSDSSSTYVENIYISDMTIDGQTETKTFSEFIHLVSLNGVRNVVFERVKFKGFRGDGLYLGSAGVGVERHNVNVTVRNCIFDGVNWDNRNGMSIIDGSNITVTENLFTNCSKANMPGALDIEPNANIYHVISDIKILNNNFKGNDGSSGSISLALSDIAFTVQPSDILISGNTIDGEGGNDAGILLTHTGDAVAARGHNIKVVNNTVTNVVNGFRMWGINGLKLTGNTFSNVLWGSLIGYPEAGKKNLNVSITKNTFSNMGYDNTSGGKAIAAYTVDYLDLSDNTFIDCGKDNGSMGVCVEFGAGTSSYVSMLGNKFLDPSNVITSAVIQSSHTFNAATNKSFRNDLVDCTGFAFTSGQTDKLTAYTVTASGETAAGVGTYTTQKGFYTRTGDSVFFAVELVWTAHTGTGALNVSLPFTVASGIGLYQPITVTSSEITLPAGTQMHALAQTATSRMRFFSSSAGTLTAVAVPASGTLWITGTYLAE